MTVVWQKLTSAPTPTSKALERVCRELPNGGDHARKIFAEQLIKSAKRGDVTLGGSNEVQRKGRVREIIARILLQAGWAFGYLAELSTR